MGIPCERALYQSFPMLGNARAQIWPYASQYRRPRHFHAEHELNLIVSGRARFGIGELVVDVEPGELLSFPPGQDHVLLEGSTDLVLLAFGMKPNLTTEVSSYARCRTWLPMRTRPNPREWAVLVQRGAALAGSDAPGHVAELWERVQDLQGSEAARGSRGIHVLTRRSLDILSTAPDLGRVDLARFVRGSPSEVSRFFHRDIGMTLVEYRTRLRLMQFIRLVDGRCSNLTAAALSSGFGSYSQCHRSFQAVFACAPREFFGNGLRERMEQAFEPL